MNKISTKDRAGRAKPLEKPKISTAQQKIAPDLADIIVNPDNHTVYKRGKFLGKVYLNCINFLRKRCCKHTLEQKYQEKYSYIKTQ